MPFRRYQGSQKEYRIEEVTCGGENRFKYKLPVAPTSQNLVLKGALLSRTSKLATWCASTLDNGLSNKIITNDVTVSLMKTDTDPAISWVFHKSYPVKYSISDLKSDENKIAIETIELAYSFFEVSSGKTK